MAEGKIVTMNEITTPTVSNLRQNSQIYVRQIGRLVFGWVTADDVPSNAWTKIGSISSKPLISNMITIVNTNISSYGELNINANGEVQIYHATGSNKHFGNQSFMYIS